MYHFIYHLIFSKITQMEEIPLNIEHGLFLSVFTKFLEFFQDILKVCIVQFFFFWNLWVFKNSLWHYCCIILSCCSYIFFTVVWFPLTNLDRNVYMMRHSGTHSSLLLKRMGFILEKEDICLVPTFLTFEWQSVAWHGILNKLEF